MAEKGGGALRTWLFLGPEIGEKQNAINDLRKKIGGGSGGGAGGPGPGAQAAGAVAQAIEETVYYAGETPVPQMVSAMLNGSLFADTRLFFIKNAEALDREAELLAEYIVSPADSTFLVLVSEETKAAKALEKAVPSANKRVFWELSDSRKTEWVESFFRREGFRISREGVETILELVENNTAALRQECSRLTLFLDKAQEISAEDAEKWLSHTREESAFTLFTRIAAGDFSRALECVRVLLAAKEAPQAIFATLAGSFRKLIAYCALKEAGVNDEGEFRKIGVIHPGAKRDYAAAARRWNSAGAETCLALTAEFDMLVRSSSSFSEQILMDRFLYKIHSCAYNAGAPVGTRG